MASFLQGIVMGAAQEGTRSIRASAKAKAARKLAEEKAEAQAARETANIELRGGFQESAARIRAKGTTDAAKFRIQKDHEQKVREGILGGGEAGARLAELIPSLVGRKDDDNAYAILIDKANEIFDPKNTELQGVREELGSNSEVGLRFKRLVRLAYAKQNAEKILGDGTKIIGTGANTPNVTNQPWMKGFAVSHATKPIENAKDDGNDATLTPAGDGKAAIGQEPTGQTTVDNSWNDYKKGGGKVKFKSIMGAAMYNESTGSTSDNYAKSVASYDILSDIVRMQSEGLAIPPNNLDRGKRAFVQITTDTYGGDLAGSLSGLAAGYPKQIISTGGNLQATRPVSKESAAGTRENQQELMSTQDNTIISLTQLYKGYSDLSELGNLHGTQFFGGLADSIKRLQEEIVGFKDAVPLLRNLLSEGLSKGAEVAQAAAQKINADKILDALKEENDKITAKLQDTTDVSEKAKLLRSQIAARETILVFSLVKSIQKGDKVSNEDFKLMRDALAGGKGFGKVANRLPAIRTVMEEVISRKVDAGKLALIDNDGSRRGFANKMETAFYHTKYGPNATRAAYVKERSAQLIGATPPPVAPKGPPSDVKKSLEGIRKKAEEGNLGK